MRKTYESVVYKYSSKEEMGKHIQEMKKQGYEFESYSDGISIFTIEYKKHF